eukprot:302277-Pyramimonas_sp.AAC.1
MSLAARADGESSPRRWERFGSWWNSNRGSAMDIIAALVRSGILQGAASHAHSLTIAPRRIRVSP